MRFRTLAAAGLAAALAVLTLTACSGPSALGPTPTPPHTATPDPLQTWLTQQRKDLLLSTLKQLAPQAGWVAGCVFESKEDTAILNALKKPSGRAFYSEFTDQNLGAALAVRVEGTPAGSGEFIGASPNPSTYCYAPKP